ncbi:putative RNA-directed DNA polymerase from transposon BS [Trichonephila clavipes]|nr:putative RNA-directed DNA polymerase from transposon BS [Trichonephila clavipes]
MLAKNFKKYFLDEDSLVASYEWIRDLFQDTPEGLSTSEEEIFIDFTSSEKLKGNFVINRSLNLALKVNKSLPWISNFLNHRSFCVNFHTTFSDSYKTYQGIPECCVLSPTLFSLFISGVEKYVNPSQIGLFADDVVLWCSDANISKIESQLYRSLVNIQEFAANHKITFNASKSTVSLFTAYRNLYNYSPEIFLMSERLNYSKYPTYLGFPLDSEVNCGKHIEKIADKARKRLKILKYLSGRDWGSDASTLRITYTTLIPQYLNMDTKSFK